MAAEAGSMLAMAAEPNLEPLISRIEQLSKIPILSKEKEGGRAVINGLGPAGPYSINNKIKTLSLTGGVAAMGLNEDDSGKLRDGTLKVSSVSIDMKSEVTVGDHALQGCFLTIQRGMETEFNKKRIIWEKRNWRDTRKIKLSLGFQEFV